MGYSLDLKGSEFYTINIRKIVEEKIVDEKIENTSGGITFSKDSKYIFYTLLNKKHQPKKVFRHKIGSSQKEDELIYEEMDERFTVGMGGLTTDEKFFLINSFLSRSCSFNSNNLSFLLRFSLEFLKLKFFTFF